MTINTKELKKQFLLLKEIFEEAIQIRNQSYLAHKTVIDIEKGKPENEEMLFYAGDVKSEYTDYSRLYDLFDEEEKVVLGFPYQQYVMDHYNWDIEEVFKMAANLNIDMMSLENHTEKEKGYCDNIVYEVPLKQDIVNKLVQDGMNNIESFQNNLDS